MKNATFVAPNICFTSAEPPEILACGGHYIQIKFHLNAANVLPYILESAMVGSDRVMIDVLGAMFL